ncbi:LysR family transcriptional regulator [Pseudomonas sp. MAFF212428]|uniref:LysR family transcriptional regulator n=1 Tax=Pseudomonas brassicae TaxID=2708063 RepID=A0A6B3NSR7_9PSED|nr:LysR substrate-binding domain-containing protein [Pseudomonas brassicae]NER60664.1 LysR family transcriptional regulator [Pseudomonas brassicae]NER65179.1 LysR family transcriptional regulator [Pseudomonas brassicae]
MRPVSFDIDVLRSFVYGVQSGSFALAADKLARSTSAISAQMKKLEAQVGEPLLRKAGRGLALTEAGEQMFAYAQRLVSLNDEAVFAVSQASLQGWVSLGLQEDLSGFLPSVLGQFARAHPKVRVQARIARNAELLSRLDSGALDVAVVWGEGDGRPGERIADLPMRWIGSQAQPVMWTAGAAAPLPLIMFDSPCPFYAAATRCLEATGQTWQVSFTSSSLQGLSAATQAGLGYTVRTRLGLPAGNRLVDEQAAGLPPLPSIALTLCYRQARHSAVVMRLASIVSEAIQAQLS